MKINPITQTQFRGAGIKVLASDNAHNKYLYNIVMDIVKENHVSAIFSNKGIDFSSVTDKVIKELTKVGVIFKK